MGVLIAIIAYLIGNFSSATIFSKVILKEDVRTKGSGNAGASNMLRNYGLKMGLLTLACDMAKGTIAVLIGKAIGGANGSYIAAVFVVLGHNYPALLGFRGGKGVATSVGVMFMINWQITLVVFVAGVLLICITKIVAISSICGYVIYPILIIFAYWGNWNLILAVVIIGIMGIFAHRGNIKRLMNGGETKISFSKK